MVLYMIIFNIFLLINIIYLSKQSSCNCNYILKYKKSQFNQDLALHYSYFQHVKNGFFIEIGAYDGISISNTYFFEKNFNWKGILIEGGIKNCNNLQKNSLYRNNSIIICSPICKSKYVNYKEDGYLGAIIKSSNSNNSYICNSLKNITQHYKIKHIDLFSLDVEGSELEVLETFENNKKGYYITS